MNNKLNNMVQDFLKNVDAKNDEELNEKLNEFMEKYNNGEIEYKNTPLDDAYELLDKAQRATSEKEVIKYAKKAYKDCPACFDALLFLLQFESNPMKAEEMLNEGLEKERKRLEKEGFFDKDNIGEFYTIFETRPYIRGLSNKALFLVEEGKISKAKELCKEIIKLNDSDNTGARYLLMAIYAYLEDEKEILKLYNEYKEEDLEMLFPLFILYYKLENDKKAKEYLNKVIKCNKHIIEFFKGEMKEDHDTMPGYYSPGKESEVTMYVMNYGFLLITVPEIGYYISENSKKKI